MLKIFFRIYILILLLLSFGCATTSKAIRGPDGKVGHSLTCPRSIENCYEKAAQLCPNGYKVNNTQDQSGVVQNSYSGQITQYNRYNMFITCKK